MTTLLVVIVVLATDGLEVASLTEYEVVTLFFGNKVEVIGKSLAVADVVTVTLGTCVTLVLLLTVNLLKVSVAL